MAAPVTGLYVALYLLLSIGLALRVVVLRRRLRVGIGDGDQPELARAIRVHANGLEIPPLVLLLALIAELGGAAPLAIHAACITLFIGRALHIRGLSAYQGRSFGRFHGTALTWIAGVALALIVLAQWWAS